MAREQANINTSLWADRDWRLLPMPEKYLYILLLTHPTINYAGVVDWRPAKIAMLSPDTTPESIVESAVKLQAARFIFVDEDSEEVLIRSYLRHDGILKQPKLSVSMANAYAAISSTKIQDVVAYELHRLRKEHEDWAAWRSPKVQAVLKHHGQDMSAFTLNAAQALPIEKASVWAGVTPTLDHSLPLPTTTATTTATYPLTGVSASGEVEREAGRTGTRIPKGFTATAQMIAWALENTPIINWQSSTKKFKAHYNSAAGPAQFKTDWESAWKSWLLGDQERAETRPQQFKTAAERKLDAGAAMHAKYSAIEEQNQLALEGGP